MSDLQMTSNAKRNQIPTLQLESTFSLSEMAFIHEKKVEYWIKNLQY